MHTPLMTSVIDPGSRIRHVVADARREAAA
jgi:hypothetical protein